MLKRSVDITLSYEARRRTKHDQREDAEVELQHVCLLVPRQAILGQDSEQLVANGLLCRCVSIMTHLVRVEDWWRSPKDKATVKKMTMKSPPTPLNGSLKRGCSVSKKGAVYTLEDSFNQDGQDGNPCEPRVADTVNPSADASRKLHIRLQTLNLLFDRWIMWEKTPRRPLEVLGLCRNAISRSRRDDEAGSAIPVRLRPVHSRMMRRIRITKAKIRPVSQLCMLVMPRCVHETLLD